MIYRVIIDPGIKNIVVQNLHFSPSELAAKAPVLQSIDTNLL
jgi:hypothetical protein